MNLKECCLSNSKVIIAYLTNKTKENCHLFKKHSESGMVPGHMIF